MGCCKELEDRIGKGHAYCKLGDAYSCVGQDDQSKEFYELYLRISRELGNMVGECQAYRRLSSVSQYLSGYEQAVEYQKQHLDIAKRLGDRSEEGFAYGQLGSIFHSLGEVEKAIEYYYKQLSIICEIGDRNELIKACGNLGRVHHSLHEFKKAIEYHETQLSIAKTEGRRADEARAKYELGRNFESLESLTEAAQNYRSSAELFEEIRAHLPRKKNSFFQDKWKINFFDAQQCVNTALCRTLLKLNKVSEALVVAENGRAQSLVDILRSRYGIGSFHSLSATQALMNDTFNWISTNTVVLRLDGDKIYIWLLLPAKAGQKVQFVKRTIDSAQDVEAFWKAMGGTRSPASLLSNDDKEILDLSSSLCLIHRLVFGGISDFLQGEELVIVPDGPLYFVPFAALRESIQSNYFFELFRIRLFPSLTSMKIIADSPQDYHRNSDGLLVGDPYNDEIASLPAARQEVILIGRWTGIKPLIGEEATKAVVLQHLNSVALIHIAAHGAMETGEVLLASNPKRTSDIAKKEDCILRMAEVLTVGVRARLVVLSCCHSGHGKLMSEGNIGIARAFIAAGARSVLVSLSAIEDEATLMFMKEFYKEMLKGSTASKALNKAMECLRNSTEFCELRHWAPFVLIGDDVTLDMFLKPEQTVMPDAGALQCK